MQEMSAAQTIMERSELLAGFSEEKGRLTRPFATESLRRATEVVRGWMQEAGMQVRQDQIGNLIGLYPADVSDAKMLLFGSHLDTVHDAGKYDGTLGVLVAIACVQSLHACQRHLPFCIGVIAFADEEGLRYQHAYLGSSVVAGTFDSRNLQLKDANGIPLASAIRQAGGEPDLLGEARWDGSKLLGYCEVHIEQGPVLETQNLPVGVVSAISGQSRIRAQFMGKAGHAGTVPMKLRQDALCGAAEFVLQVERQARELPDLVATIGQLDVQPGASNVIPGLVTLSLDVRHSEDTLRVQACQRMYESAQQMSTARGITLNWQLLQAHKTIACSPTLSALLSKAIQDEGYPLFVLPSGAGHDAAVMATITPVCMLFVRCAGGISHHPDEAVTCHDVAVALGVLTRFLDLLVEDLRQ